MTFISFSGKINEDVKFLLGVLYNVSVNSNWVHSPGQPPGISSKNLPGGRDLTFKSCPGGREINKGRDFVKNESECSKICVDLIFKGENKQSKKKKNK